MKKKLLSLTLCVAMAATALAGCGSDSKKSDATTKANGDKKASSDESVYFLNFKPEAEETFNKIAKKYTKDTGVDCKVVTAADNQYESTLKTEMAKKDAPTAFIVNGPVGYESWKDYCADIKDSDLYSQLVDKNGVVSSGDGIYGLPLATEFYGLICDKAIFEKYFGLSGIADTGCKKIEDINSFEKLSAVVKDMDKHKDDLGIKGVFSEPAVNAENFWRLTTHLFNVPLYYEYMKDDVTNKDEIDFSFADNYKNIFDLYLENSTVEKANASSGSVDDAMTEFALKECAIVQNGTWGWGQIDGTDGNEVKKDDVYFMPIYTGAEGEEKQGLCAGTENFLAINSKASEADQKASLDFFNWLYTSDEGKKLVSEDLQFVSPYEGAIAPENPLVKQGLDDAANADTTTVNWVFPTIPSESWKSGFYEHLLKYAEGSEKWDAVVSGAKELWKSEKSASSDK